MFMVERPIDPSMPATSRYRASTRSRPPRWG